MPVSMNKVVRCLLIKRQGASQGTGSPDPIIHLYNPQDFCITIVCNFSWDMKMSPQESKTMPMQIFRG